MEHYIEFSFSFEISMKVISKRKPVNNRFSLFASGN